METKQKISYKQFKEMMKLWPVEKQQKASEALKMIEPLVPLSGVHFYVDKEEIHWNLLTKSVMMHLNMNPN